MDLKLISKVVNYMKFYRLSTDEGKKKKYAFGILISDYPSKTIKCPSCHREWRKELLLEKETNLTICLSNSYYADFSGVVYHTLISEKAKDIFYDTQIKGYTLGEMEILKKEEVPQETIKELRDEGYKVKNISDNPPRYYRLFVEIGARLHPKSEVIPNGYCKDCGYEDYVTKGEDYVDPFHPLYIKHDSWNGNDLFMVKELGGAIFCSQRFVDIYTETKLTGLLFKCVPGL
jgi:predicted Zn-ribbon and HTH transcriptional regulator